MPAASVAVTLMVLAPLARVMPLDHAPPVPTVTAPWSLPLSSILMVTGELVASLVVPATVRVWLLVMRPSVGLVTLRVGGTVSTV